MRARPLDLQVSGEPPGAEWEAAGVIAGGRHYFTILKAPGYGPGWARVTRLQVRSVEGQKIAEFRFRPESAAPPWLVGAALRAATAVRAEPDGTLKLDFPAAAIRVRGTVSGAVLEFANTRSALIAPASPVNYDILPDFSGDGRWIAVTAPGSRTARIWSTATGTACSEAILDSTSILSATFADNDTNLIHLRGNGSVWTTYAGTRRFHKPKWLAGFGSALTGARMSPSGYSLEWLPKDELRSQRRALFQSLQGSNTRDRGARLILERWQTLLDIE
jgi:hypothetical protein